MNVKFGVLIRTIGLRALVIAVFVVSIALTFTQAQTRDRSYRGGDGPGFIGPPERERRYRQYQNRNYYRRYDRDDWRRHRSWGSRRWHDRRWWNRRGHWRDRDYRYERDRDYRDRRDRDYRPDWRRGRRF